MRFTQHVCRCIAAMCFSVAAFPAFAGSGEIAADRNPITRGQEVTLKWYFKGDKIVISGGRFGKGVDVTGRTSISDKPVKTTPYKIEVWYSASATNADGVPGKPKQQHAKYTVAVDVIDPQSLGLETYRSQYGWEIERLKGWRADVVPMPDPGSNALIFFQPEEDSVERIAVSILPVSASSCAALLKKVEADLPGHYNAVEVLNEIDLTFENVPATLMTFEGEDQSHPGTKTRSLVLTFVRDGLGYVISGRTQAARFESRRGLLEAMIKSFVRTSPAPKRQSPSNEYNPSIA